MKASANLTLSALELLTQKKGNYLKGTLDYARLYTALQPIFSLAHKRIIGYEALVRARDNNLNCIDPAWLFLQNKNAVEEVRLDRLCRIIHLHNFLNLDDDVNWLFLNVSPETIINGKEYGSFFGELLEKYNFPPHRIVIEVTEHPLKDNGHLSAAINYYKSLGCLIAIDDFGAGHSNFNRIWTLKPNIVKLDRSFLVKASTDATVRSMLSGLVSLIHQSGSLVLIEGVETGEQALMAIESEVDFVQGFFFARPFLEIKPKLTAMPDFDILFNDYKDLARLEENDLKDKFIKYTTLFDQSIQLLKKGMSLEDASIPLLKEPKIVRSYRVGTDGIQIGNTMISYHFKTREDPRFKPLEDANSADWFRRHYLRRAILHPGQLQITRPYLSITGAHMCVTLSMRFSNGFQDSILCCDLLVTV